MPSGIPDTTGTEIILTVKLGGTILPPEIGLLSVMVERTVNKIATAQLILMDDDTGDEPYSLSEKEFTKPGTEIEISAGYDDATTIIFKGIIVSQRMKIDNRRSTMILECKDKSIKMTMNKRSAYYYDKTDSDIWEQLIAEAGLKADSTTSAVQHQEMVQYRCTDWDFMLSRADANGLMVITKNGTIKFMKPPESGKAVIKASYGDNVFEFDADMDARTQVKNIETSSWDASAQEIMMEESAEPFIVTNGNISGKDLSVAITDETCTIKHSGNFDRDELKTFGNAKLLKSRMARIQGRVKILGTGEVDTGDIVTLDGFGSRFNGDVIATAVRHEFSAGNWMTDIQFGLSPKWYAQENDVQEDLAAAMLPAIQGLQIGIVTVLENDPDGENRIKVKIPLISSDEDGIWTRQATTDAGNTRGWVIRPEIGDEVIVGFINNDPRDAVVLGSLHSSANSAPIDAEDANNEKGWVTRSGIKMLIDDKKKTIELSTPAGNKILMDEDAQKITITDQNKNSIEMSSDGIKIESVKDISIKAGKDIKMEGINVEVKASAAFKSEGSASAEIKSSGTTTVKGSMVMIN